MIHKGSCHCGKVACEADCEIGEVVSCSCSICRRKGHWLLFVPLDKFKLTTPRDDLSDYSFGPQRIHHHFCRACGCSPFALGRPQRIHHHFCRACGCSPFALGRDGKGNEMAAINVRCLEDVDLDALTIRHFDGRSV